MIGCSQATIHGQNFAFNVPIAYLACVDPVENAKRHRYCCQPGIILIFIKRWNRMTYMPLSLQSTIYHKETVIAAALAGKHV